MKILLFTNTPSNYKKQKGGYNGGGWISSFEKSLKGQSNIELAIAFQLQNEEFKVEGENVVYYPISLKKVSFFSKIRSKFLNPTLLYDRYVEECLKVVKDFQPDIIHVFGSESFFGQITNKVDIPVILHIQGILNPYFNAYLPPSVSWSTYIFKVGSLRNIFIRMLEKRRWQKRIEYEARILRSMENYTGRTVWDERIVKLYNPNCRYFHCDEILRDSFYECSTRSIPEQLMIVTTISSPLYKGVDVLLKAAELLKVEYKLQFIWKCFGNVDLNVIEMFSKKSTNLGVCFCGIADEQRLQKEELNATVFVHPSYIDNSPNSLCEAQILGCPVIAVNAGGVSSLVEDGKTGYLVPANDPYQIAYLIKELHENKHLNRSIGEAGRAAALKRHDRFEIISRTLDIYKELYNEK
ncbi:MAG: glycosyltransferase [Paludibacteraceae bacterium]|nr:glycosyltransferase [Paludibacteraceae bacterium]MCQ2218224.1 glycosyltransferase [Paludibacteraceae bacterium]